MAVAEALETAEQEQEPEGHDFGEVDFERVRRLMEVRQGREFLPYPGLVELLHQVSEGYFSIETQLVQAPTQDNGQVAICTARVLIYDPDNPDVVRRAATGIGDASPSSVNRQMGPHLLRMAETRAKARALRDAVNAGMVAYAEEELVPEAVDAPPDDTIEIEGQRFSRSNMETIYLGRVEAATKAKLPLPEADLNLPKGSPLTEYKRVCIEIRRRLEAIKGQDR